MNTKYILIPLIFSSFIQCALTHETMNSIKSKDAIIETIPKRLLNITESEDKIIIKVEAIEKSSDRFDRYVNPTKELCFILPATDNNTRSKIKANEDIPCPEIFKPSLLTKHNKPNGLLFIGNKYVLRSPGDYDIYCNCSDFPEGKEFKEILVGNGLFDKHFIILFQDGSAYALHSGIAIYPEGVFSSERLEHYLNNDPCNIYNISTFGHCEKKTIFHSKPNFGSVGSNYSKVVVSYPDNDIAYISIMFANFGFLPYEKSEINQESHFTFKKSNSKLPHSISYFQIIPSSGKPYKSRVKKERILLLPLMAAFDIILLPVTIPLFAIFYLTRHK
ncbi:hypothetical protein EHR01_06425 [Leptospira mtsangambouensis]|uniref:6-bladed beta-propeller n=2 Tax=Leptospira mtsangambouensis TaxID=2484912 RepID=A0ABY2P4V0_9LEPT|nr:hypothetical protein EHR01_06425 [Leptospira mtsangambouensis]